MNAVVKDLVERLQSQPSHTGSLIVTLFGDAIMPRGGSVAMATILDLMELFGIAPGVVRTAISRLAADGWIASSRQGRMSFYCIAKERRGEFMRAARQIFGPTRRRGASRLYLAMLEPGEARIDRRARLNRLGFVSWQGLMVAPERPLPNALAASLPMLVAEGSTPTMRLIASQAWRLDELAAQYQVFLDAFTPLAADIGRSSALSDTDAILARLLLTHDFRRVALRDPRLPDALLPEDWPGRAARDLCAMIYPALLPRSEHWLDEHARTGAGQLPAPEAELFRRFND